MGVNGEEWEARWTAEIARLTSQIDDLRAGVDSDVQNLRIYFESQIAALQAEVKRLETQAVAAGADAYISKIEAQIAHLQAQGDAAYALLQDDLKSRPDSANSTNSMK